MILTPTGAIPPSQNEAWGFFGTITHHAEPRAAWDLAVMIVTQATGRSYDEVRAFLDSRQGRHFADTCANHMTDDASRNGTAIAAAAQEWMGWRIGRRASDATGIPMGLPYLTGRVMEAAIAVDAE